MFSGTGLPGLDGTAWYHPLRLTIDAGAVAAGNANPAQDVLDARAIHGHDLPRDLRIYAFGAALGGQRVLDAATVLASQSGIPSRNLLLVDRQATYSHDDPNSAFPLVPFLRSIGALSAPPRLPLLLRRRSSDAPPLAPAARASAAAAAGRRPRPDAGRAARAPWRRPALDARGRHRPRDRRLARRPFRSPHGWVYRLDHHWGG